MAAVQELQCTAVAGMQGNLSKGIDSKPVRR